MPEKVGSEEGSSSEPDTNKRLETEKSDSEKAPECSVQKDEITPQLNKRLEKGDTWYLLDVRWFKQWKKYVGFESWDQQQMGSETAHPGPVDTSCLFKDREREVLKDHLMEDLDYSLVPEEVWKKFTSWYGIEESSRVISRRVVEHGLYVKHCKVEVYLVEFKLALHPDIDSVVTKKFSRADNVEHVMNTMKQLYNIPEEKECRLWHKYMLSTYDLLNKLDETIQDAGLYTNQLLLLEQKKDDDTWPRETTTYTGTNMTSVRSSDFSSTSTHSTSSAYTSTTSTISSMRSTNPHYFDHHNQPCHPGVCGLSNLGNTCFMNSALQCLSNTYTLTDYFLKDAYRKHINEKNPLGMGGNLAKAYGSLLHEMWSGNTSYTHPRNLKATIGKFAPQFVGYAQHDSQELLAFLLDGLHEDLNQVLKKPYVDMDIKSEERTDKEIAKEAWTKYLLRNKSVVVKLFQGQLKSTLTCPDCKKVSRIFDPFMYMSLPLPIKKTRDLVIYLVRVDPTKRIEKVKITVPKHGNISALLREVSVQTKVDKDKMVVIDVYNCRFHKIFDARENISLIMDRDDIYCYEVAITSAQDPNYTVIPVYNREKVVRTVNYTYGSSYTTTYHQLFGVPQLVTVPREDLDYRKLYNILLDHMRRYVKRQSTLPSTKKPVKIPPAGYDEVDKQVGDDNADNTMDTDDKTGDNDTETTSETKMDEDKKGSDDEQEDPKPKDYFTMCLVNGYGSQVLRNLTDDDTPLTLNNNTYVACDWDSRWKEECYDLTEAEFKENHKSMLHKSDEEKKKNINLLDCVKLFTVEEQLGEEDPWYCPSCKGHKQAFKKFDLWKLPEILVIHLKRFTYNRYWRDKLDVLVDFPIHELDLSEQLINLEEPDPIYDLFAVTNHYGGMGGGHYTSYARNSHNSKWYHFDDSHVSETDENHLMTSAAYVLFYKRRIDNQPVLLRRMSSYTHRDPSQDETNKTEATSINSSSVSGVNDSYLSSSSKNDSKSKQYDSKLPSTSNKDSFPITGKESLKTAVTNTVVTSAPKPMTETYGNTERHPQKQKKFIQSTTPKIVNQMQAGGSVNQGSTVSSKSVIKSADSVKICVPEKPVQTQSEATVLLETLKSDGSEKSKIIIDELTERIAKIETESMQKITSISNRMESNEDDLAKRITSLTERLDQKEEEIAAQDTKIAQLSQKNEREASQKITALNEKLKQSKRENATMVEGLRERLQLKENRLTVLNQKMNDLQERLQEKEDDTNQKVASLTDRLEQTKREANQSTTEANQKITTLSDRLLLKDEELTVVNQEFAAFQERTQELEIQQQERMQAQETQLQTFCNNALQQMRQQIEAETRQQIQQVTNQLRMMEKLFNAVKPQWLISQCEITLSQHELGKGGWGRVVRATFRSKQVAAKCLHHQIISYYNIQQFVREMQISSKCHHPNLLRFLGATLEGDPIILTELMDTNLYDVIRRHELKDHQIIPLLQDIATAISYLHSLSPEPIIHRDISSSNVLLNGPVRSKWIVKLSDFGSANFLWHTSEQSRAPGNPTYAAPEVLSPHSHSEKMDVYSFGVLLFEICSGQAPSLHLRNEVLPTAAAVWPEPYRHFVPLIVSCTRDNKDERPTMSDVLAEL